MADDLDLAVFEEVSSGLIGADDIQEAGGVLQPDSSAGILVYENVWAAPLAREIRLSGGRLVASGRIPVHGDLKASGVLTEAEFEVQKDKILHG